jgi:hypothetical protein
MSKRIEEIAKQMELTGPFPQERYIKHMLSAFGRNGNKFMCAVDNWLASGCDVSGAEKLYGILAKYPLMAHYVTRHQYSAIYQSIAATLTSWGQLQERTIIDIGCGFGHLTNMLARLHPSSQLIGMDKANIVNAARRLNDSPAVANLEYRTAKELPLEAAQVALMICVTHEAFPSLSEPEMPPLPPELEFAKKISGFMERNGLLVTINRFPYPMWQLPSMDQLLGSVGFYPCDEGLPSSIQLQAGGQTSFLPIRTYRYRH